MESDPLENRENKPNLRDVLALFQELGEAEKQTILETLQSPGVTPTGTEDSVCKNVNKVPEKKSYQEQPTSTEATAASSSSALAQNSFTTFKKRPGCISQGDDFEIWMCALYALKLSTSDDVVDFNMTSNEDKCGAFDDIKLDVRFKNGTHRVFLLQLKHKNDNKKCIRRQHLFSQQGDFSLPKHFKSQTEIDNKNAVFIICTNCQINIEEGVYLNEISIGKCSMEYEDIILNNQESDFIFQCKSETNQIIYLLGGQKNLHKTQSYIKQKLRELLQRDIYSSFFNFMKEWWSGRFVLNKSDFIAKLTELALSPFLKNLSGSKHNEKSFNLKRAIMEFQMTVVKTDEDTIVESIWPTDKLSENKDYEKIAKKFVLDLDVSSKILWYMSKVPLIVKVNECNKETVKSILQLFQKSRGRRKIVLIGNITKRELNEWDIFENLEDLIKKDENEDINRYIPQNFYVSLQGRNSVSVKELLGIDKKFGEILEVEHLLKMSQEDLIIGEQFQQQLDDYISRDVSMLSFNIEEMFAYYSEKLTDSLIILNCDQKCLSRFSNFTVSEVSDYLKDRSVGKKEKLVLFNQKCTLNDFERVYQKSDESNLYLFQVKNDNCILIMSKGRPLQFQEKNVINEKFIHHHFSNSFNVFCAPPGMGKTTLMQVLCNQTPSKNWAIYVNLIKHNSFLSTDPDNEAILNHFLELKKGSLLSKVKELLRSKAQLFIYLDGLDELDSKNFKIIITFIKYVSSQKINIWVSSRENLREKLSEHLNAVPIDIQELDKEQQKKYIRKRLQNKIDSGKIEKIMDAIFQSSDINNSRDLLGIPLQLYIITEMFLTNDDAFENLRNQNFVLTQMYKLYFEGKKKSLLKKLGLEEEIEYQLGINYESILEQYEIPALKTCLDADDYRKLELDENRRQNFLRRIKEKGDKYGIIKVVDENWETVFVHQTYAEYFACSWLKKNLEKVRLLLDRIFSERYENLRLMFDVMLAEKNPLHLAIIYKNMEQFVLNIHQFEEKDFGGRTAFCLACTYGKKYSEIPVRFGISVVKTYYCSLKRESDFYVSIMERLQDVDLKDRDHLFDLDCIQYSIRAKCLYPVEKILEREKINFHEYEKIIFECYKPEVLAGYAAQFGYSNILLELIDLGRSMPRELLNFAILGTIDDVYTIPRMGNITVVKILLRDFCTDINFISKIYSYNFEPNFYLKSEVTLLDFACNHGCFDMVEILVENGGKCSDGNTILHSAANCGNFNEIIIDIYKRINRDKKGRDVDTRNLRGQTALHLACKHGKLEMANTLIRCGSDVNSFDNDNNNIFHYVAKANKPNRELFSMLVGTGADVNARNKLGRTSLHVACEYGSDEIAIMLVENGADVNIVDNDNNNILHFYASTRYPANPEVISMFIDRNESRHTACQKIDKKYDYNIFDDGDDTVYYVSREFPLNETLLKMLMDSHFDLNSQNKTGQTALHLACEIGYGEIAKKLTENGADANILDNDNNNAFHYATRAFPLHPKLLSMLIDVGIEVNAQNKRGQTALHLVCLKGSDEIAKKLTENGADVNILDDDNNSTLHYASRADEENQKLLTLLIHTGTDFNARNKLGQTALHLACQKGHLEIVKKLVENLSDVNAVDIHNNSVLHYASKCNKLNTNVLQILINFGVEINAKNIRNETPLHLACKAGVIENATELINSGADISSNRNLLHYAAASNNADLLRQILYLGFEINARDFCGASALHIACKFGNIEVVKELICYKADISAVDNKGMTVLHYATLAKHNEKLITYLLKSGIDSQVKDSNGRDALNYALEKERYSTLRIFIENKIFCENFKTESVMFLYCSVYSGSNKGVELFLESYGNMADVDMYNEDFPLYFASRNGQLDTKIMGNMTTFIEAVIVESKKWSENFSRRCLINYLKFKEQKYDDIDFIFRSAENTNNWKWYRIWTEIELFLKAYNEQQSVSPKTSLDSDDDF